MRPPVELIEAEVIEAICQRYHVPPSVAVREPTWVLRHMTILNLANSKAPIGDGPGEAPSDDGLADLMVSL